MALTTPERFGAGTAASLTRDLTSKKSDMRGRTVEALLLGALLMSLLVLVALVVNLFQRAWPILDT
ncbi:MAG: hypothetical protein ACKOBT_08910, partial [Actinomycetota bacterium]